MRPGDFLAGRRVLAEAESSVNGKLVVVRDLAWGTHILAGGITQSGGVVELIWRKALEKVSRRLCHPSSILILGLGGASIAKLAWRLWPGVRITGVDVDPVMVELGVKYLELDESKVKVEIQDALDFVRATAYSHSYDLVCVDLYVGERYPKKFESMKFLRLVRELLNSGAVAVFNRLYYKDKKMPADRFQKRLGKVFSRIEVFRPEANVMFLCLRSATI